MTLIVLSFFEAMVDRNPIVKDEAFTLPFGFGLWHFLKILKNASLQVVNLVEPLFKHIGGRFLASNATRTKHRDFFMFRGVHVFFNVRRKFSKGRSLRIKCPLERPNFKFVIVASIHQHHIGIRNELIPILGVDVAPHHNVGINTLNPHSYNFFFKLHLHSIKRLFLVIRFFVL